MPTTPITIRRRGRHPPWGILPPPALGAALMALSTIVVALNAQTLRRLAL